MIRLVVTDMDGTLLPDEKEIPSDFWEVEKLLWERGILFGVASGRQMHTLRQRFRAIENRTLFLAENGTLVMHRGQVIHSNPLGREIANHCIGLAKPIKGAHVLLCGQKSAYTDCRDRNLLKIFLEYFEELEIVDDLLAVEDTVLKVTVYDTIHAESNSYPILSPVSSQAKLAVGGMHWLDITGLTANKGSAMAHVQQLFGISPSETMVFGDYLNDLEMMGTAYHSYAMPNSHPEIIKAARYITKFDNNSNGVVKTIRMMLNGNLH